jgi:2-succinyl-6-hydroxy-2,4-cyclohexadiene-1-carboxylate synthase
MLTAIHGFTETDAVWRDLLGATRPGRCELVPGHGWRPCSATATIASVAAEMAARLPPGSDLLGYSMGGRIALRLALDHPGLVRRLILVSTSPGIADAGERARRRARDERLAQILEEDGIAPFVAWWEANPVLRPARPLPRKVEEDLRCLRLNQDPIGLAGSLRHLGAGVSEPLWQRLGELRIPVLLVAGADDPRYGTACADMAKAIPGAEMALVPDCGHAVHREMPHFLLGLVSRFLN